MTDFAAHSTQSFSVSKLTDAFSNLAPVTDTLVRLAAGLFLVPHGAQKLFGWFGGYGLDATGQFFETQLGFANGFMVALASGSVEFFGGLFLALGLLTRLSALAATALLVIAASVHIPAGFFWTAGGFEYPVLWALVTLGFVARGGGRFSLDRALNLKI